MKSMMRALAAFVAMLSLITVASGWSGAALAHDDATPEASMSMGAAYFDVTNGGTEADTLVSAKSDVAMTVEVHEVVDKDGVMTMQPLTAGLEIPAGATVNLAPGGYHIMLIGLAQSLEAGMVYDLTLTFATAGEVVISVPVHAEGDTSGTPPAAVTVGSITVANQWSRPAPKLDDAPMSTATAGAFLTITNSGTEDDRLLSVTSTVAGTAEVHDMKEGDDGVMEMTPLTEPLVIPAGGSVTLESGGKHVMLIGITHDLTEGGSYDLVLAFEKAGEVTITVPVTATAPDTAAAPVTAGTITVSGAWTRPAPAMMSDDAAESHDMDMGEESDDHMDDEGTPESDM